MDNYKIVGKIGSGNFAKVFLAVHTKTGQQVALKLVNKRENKSPLAIRRINSEVTNLKLLQGHQNIVNFVDAFETSKHFVIAMEYVSGGELFDYVQKKGGMNETSAQEMFIDIVHGVHHCHKKGITHRDLKLENILLDENNQPKIADFGFSKDVPSCPLTSSSVGSPLYTSPEIIQGKPYQGPECDVWSLGVILYTMLTATMPFDDSNIGQFLVNIQNGVYPEPHGTTDAAKDLISRMLDPNSSTRFTLSEVLSHPWMTGLCKKVSHLLPNNKRKQSICYKSAECLLLDIHKCSHHLIANKHCLDCGDIEDNNLEMLLRKEACLSSKSSLNSSGYGSEIYGSDMGSQYWENLSSANLSHSDLTGLHISSFEEQSSGLLCHCKSSINTTRSDITGKTTQHSCFDSDEGISDIVFV